MGAFDMTEKASQGYHFWMDRIVRDPEIRGGLPVIRGTRVAVGDLVAEVARGATIRSLLRSFPLLKEEDVIAGLEYAAYRLRAANDEASPRLSIVVVIHAMPEQAKRTLLSLAPGYQEGVEPGDYEIIVVENASGKPLGKKAALDSAEGVRYFFLDEKTSSPVRAANFGVTKARAPVVALMIDGARMLTPGVVRTALRAYRITDTSVVSVPGYHLGSELQQSAVDAGYDEKEEAKLLRRIGWPEDGYRLFEIACFSGSCVGGFLRPIAESNFLCVPKSMFEELGGYDERFDLPGGGYCNLDLYARVCERSEASVFVTPGEGTFHQYHGGATTGGVRADARDELMKSAREQYAEIRGKAHRLPTRQAALIGEVGRHAMRFVQLSTAHLGKTQAVGERARPAKSA